MRRVRTWSTRLAMALVCTGLASAGRASDLAITSFDGAGRLVFSTVNIATNYCVEWASSPAGPWTNFIGANSVWLDSIPATQAGSVTCAVPMCYRVVASVTNAPYLVIDVSGGPTASSYPVSYLAAVPGGGWTDEYKTTKIPMRLIPNGTFTMGSPTNELGRQDPSDETQHVVNLTQAIYVGVFEVTQRQWERVMGNWPSYFTNATCRDTRPVENVSYPDIRGSNIGTNWPATNSVDATSFMGKLRARAGKPFDLPTESQWEYACRAGTITALNSGYDLTNKYNDAHMAAVGRYSYNGGSGGSGKPYGDTSVGTARVSSYLPNAWGLYDMHGNVMEWCLDWYGDYPGTVTDPKGAISGSYRMTGGACWNASACYCRSAYRDCRIPDSRYEAIGLRVVVPAGQ